MARKLVYTYVKKRRKKRPNVHSKNASRKQNAFKKKYRGQGRK